MAANGNFQNDAEEYEWVLNNSLLWDAVFNHFGYDPVYEYGSYRQVDTWMRSIILKWLHRQDFYWDERWGLNDVEVEEEDEEDEEDQQDALQNVVEQQNEEDAQQNVVEEQNEEDQQQNVMEHQNVVEHQNQGGQQDGFAFVDPLNLENRIIDLEIKFQYLLERKRMQRRE